MYRAKNAGGGQHVVFDEHMHQEAVRRLSLEHDLREALNDEQFDLHYQPLIELDNGRLFGFEALIRWEHPEHGRIGPDRFIPVAEETGLIFQIGQWALLEACHQVRRWDKQFPAAGPIVSVNISKAQLRAPGFVENLGRILERTGVRPHRLKLEITETAIMHDIEAVVPLLRSIREMGVWVAMDDFGTGYSSLASLHRFPIDVLKIDKAFIQSMDHSRVHAAIIQTITNLAHNLGLSVIAEGIETDEQIALLQALDCDYVQGFRFGKPVPAADLPDQLLTDRQWALTA
jgi:EAL domain-containing protein (putative c-di-GMP-specific phosphodiesterase class I)